jgi:hypothetical protein
MTSIVLREVVAVTLALLLGAVTGLSALGVFLLFVFYLNHSRQLWIKDRAAYPAFFHLSIWIRYWAPRLLRLKVRLDREVLSARENLVNVLVTPLAATALIYVSNLVSFLTGSADRFTGAQAGQPSWVNLSLLVTLFCYGWTVNKLSGARADGSIRGPQADTKA